MSLAYIVFRLISCEYNILAYKHECEFTSKMCTLIKQIVNKNQLSKSKLLKKTIFNNQKCTLFTYEFFSIRKDIFCRFCIYKKYYISNNTNDYKKDNDG